MVYKRVKIPPDLGDILVPRNFIFWLVAKNQGSYGQTDTTERFNASNRSRNTSLRWSDCRLVMLYIVVKKLWAEFFALRLWRCSGHPCNNQQSYGQMDITVGFGKSERIK